jgi:hypothetical protein
MSHLESCVAVGRRGWRLAGTRGDNVPAAFVGGSEILTRFLRPVRRGVFARPAAAAALLLLLPPRRCRHGHHRHHPGTSPAHT